MRYKTRPNRGLPEERSELTWKNFGVTLSSILLASDTYPDKAEL